MLLHELMSNQRQVKAISSNITSATRTLCSHLICGNEREGLPPLLLLLQLQETWLMKGFFLLDITQYPPSLTEIKYISRCTITLSTIKSKNGSLFSFLAPCHLDMVPINWLLDGIAGVSNTWHARGSNVAREH